MRGKARHGRSEFLVVLGLVGALAVGLAGAAAAAPNDSKKAATPDGPDQGVTGVQVAIDPATGRVRQPTPAEAQRLAAGMEKLFTPTAAPRQEVRADGTVIASVDGMFLTVAVARIGEDGVETVCVEDAASGLSFLLGAGSTPALEEK